MSIQKSSIRKIRYAIQLWFLLFCLVIGYRFFHFVLHFESGSPYIPRPASVDGFLPIAGLISFKNFLITGTIEPFHPAAFWIFTAILSVSLLVKKGFCGWICPVGTISQWFWMTGEKFLGGRQRMWRHADIALRSLKYILMGFFLFVIGFRMSSESIASFFGSDYYKVADAKTMMFFTDMSGTTMLFLAITGGLSLVYKNFWCRYLCPYGALLGILSLVSPLKIKRDEKKCIHCHACSENCPARIDLENKDVVRSSECFGCLTCVSRCPSKGALNITAGVGRYRKTLNPLFHAIALLVIFYVIIGAGITAGKWQSAVPYQEYRRIFSSDLTLLEHPGR